MVNDVFINKAKICVYSIHITPHYAQDVEIEQPTILYLF